MSLSETTAPAAVAPELGERAATPRRQARESRRALLRGARRALLGVVVLAAAVGAVMALRPRPVPVDVARVARGPLVVAIEESGTTRVKDRYVVSAPVTGTISRLNAEPGDPVAEGDALTQIAPALSPLLDERTREQAEARLSAALSAQGQARAQKARAAVARESSDRELSRLQTLVGAGSMPPQSLEQAEFDARMRAEDVASAIFAEKIATEEVRVARASLGHGTDRATRGRHVDVVAPVSGSVLRVHQKSAGVVQAGTPIVEIGDPALLEVVIDLLTTDAVRVKPGTPVTLRGWGGDGPLAGRVRRIEPSAFTRPSALGVDEQRVNVIVALTDPYDRWRSLADGYRVEARLVLWESPDVIKVPQGAVFRHGDGWGVFQIEGGVAKLTPVRVGHRGEAEVEIESGLSAGAEIGVHPGDRVGDGVRVDAR